jgi:hypothetical protein
LITAGASAPEDLVAGVCRVLLERFGGTIEQREVFEENVDFAPPGALRKVMAERGIDPLSRAIHVASPVITQERYGGVPLTVSAKPGIQ